ncbi:MAG: hypothetical protein FWG25_08610, partial [Promicromonosporaceae bacterium]|nr:hypothetical protein [Promicromonosporaceae bacterium]
MSRLELGNPQLREILWIIGISVAALLFWLYLPFNWVGDDHWFRDVVEINFAGNVFAYLAHRYESWTSRIFIELVMVTVIQHIRIWRIISALAMSLVIIIPTRLVSAQVATRVRLLPVSAILVAAIPMTVILETGYVATTLNYLWPLAAGLIAATPGVYLVQGRPVRRWWYPIAILCGLFAGSSEMVAVLLLVLYGATAVIAWPRRKCFVPNLAFAVGFLALVMFALLSPGNSARTAIETEVWWPEHAYLSFPRLIEIGFSATLRAIFLQGFTLPLIYFVVLAVILFRRWGPNWPVLIVMAPIVGLLTQGFNASVSFTTAERIIRLDNIWEAYTWYGLLRGDDPFTWFAFLLMVGLLACVILATWFAANSHWQAIMLL